MTSHGRFVRAGRLTNYELRDLRAHKNSSRYRQKRRNKDVWLWLYTWATVSQDFHPRSEQEWKERNA